MRIDLAAELVVKRLTDAGIRATVDARDLNPPAVWVTLQTASYNKFGPGHVWVGSWVLWAVTPDVGSLQSFKSLGELSDRIRGAFPTITNGTPSTLVVPAGGDPLPAISWSLTLQATDDPDDSLDPAEPQPKE